jgi:hypothetical protein
VSPEDQVSLFHRQFRLQGEDVVRRTTGRRIRPLAGSYTNVAVRDEGETHVFRLHVIKFALLHGLLPQRVDHRDRDPANVLAENLRPATPSQNAANTAYRGGVRQKPSGSWAAYIHVSRRYKHLGTFNTAEEAQEAHDAARLEVYGEYAGKRTTRGP